jgi:rod shape-determining protein MreB
MKKYKNALITENIAEDLKIKIGSASILKENESIRVTARDATSGLPMELDISSRQITEAISDCIQDLIFAIRRALENTPPELLSDIIDNGIVITGGGSLLRNIDKVIQDEVRIKVHRTADPLVNIAKGGSILLDNPLLLENIQLSLDEELETVARRSSFY